MKLREHNTIAFRFEVLRNNAVYATMYADGTPEISNIESSTLKMSLRGLFFHPPYGVNFLSDRLRPVVTINGEDFPIGVFIITTEAELRASGASSVELEGYSLLYLAARKRIESPIHITAGSNYITQIIALLGGCGITDINAESTEYVFDTDREDWETGTVVLDIVNQLLKEISYNSAWVDLGGTVRLTKYEPPGLASVDHVYSSGEASVIESGYNRTSDRYAKKNVFLVTCDNPDKSGPIAATASNDSPNSPYSTVNIGRVLYTEQVDNIPSQTALQAYADRLMYESLQETETVEFVTAILPTHASYDTVAIEVGELSGIYQETEWRIRLSANGEMIHKARRVYVGD